MYCSPLPDESAGTEHPAETGGLAATGGSAVTEGPDVIGDPIET
jgi:hypothetical protein